MPLVPHTLLLPGSSTPETLLLDPATGLLYRPPAELSDPRFVGAALGSQQYNGQYSDGAQQQQYSSAQRNAAAPGGVAVNMSPQWAPGQAVPYQLQGSLQAHVQLRGTPGSPQEVGQYSPSAQQYSKQQYSPQDQHQQVAQYGAHNGQYGVPTQQQQQLQQAAAAATAISSVPPDLRESLTYVRPGSSGGAGSPGRAGNSGRGAGVGGGQGVGGSGAGAPLLTLSYPELVGRLSHVDGSVTLAPVSDP